MKIRQSEYMRKDGRLEIYVIYEDPDTGEDKKKSFYGKGNKGKAEARRNAAKFIEKIEGGDYSDIRKVTVEAMLRKFMTVYCTKKEQTTKDGYKNYIENHIIPVLGKLIVNEVKPHHIENFYNHERSVPRVKTHKKDGKMVPVIIDGNPVPIIKDGKPVIGYSEKTILQEHRILHRAFKKAVNDGLTAKNPIDGVDAPSPDDYEPTIYTEDQFNNLIEALKGHRMEIVILLAGMCGLRRAELCGLGWEDIDLEEKIIRVKRNLVPTSEGKITKKTKNKTSTRNIDIPSAIIPSLKRLRGIGKIYTRLDGQDYNPGSVSRLFKDFLSDNELPHIRLHDLRHWNATMMLKHGVSEREAQERLGHSNPGMTKKYQHIVEDMGRKSADKLNVVFKNAK
jgi:integrase